MRGIADDQHLGPRDGVAHGEAQALEEVLARRGGDRADRGAGDDEAEGVDGVAGVGREHDVAGRGDRLREVGETFLRAQGDDHLLVGIERDVEAALVVSRLGLAQAGNALGRRIAVGRGLGRDFGELVDDVLRRRAVGIAHAEVDDVLAAGARRRLHRVDLGEDIGRQAADAVELVVHRAVLDDFLCAAKGER